MAEWRDIELVGFVLLGGRLTLRPWQSTDGDAVHTIMADERMHAFLPVPNPYTRADAEQFVMQIGPASAQAGTGLDVAIAENTSGRVVGAAAIRLPQGVETTADIGYWIGTADWGNGFAAEATRTLTRFAFAHGVSRVQIRCDVANVASARVALRSGFRFEGVLRGQLNAASGGAADGAVFGRLDSDPDDPIPLSFPTMPALTDGVVVLRPMTIDDWPVILAEQNNAEARRWAFADHEVSEAQARAQAARAKLGWLVGGHALVTICDAATGSPAGTMVLRQNEPPDVMGIGYGVIPEFRGRRFTTRALTLLSDWAFGSGVHRLELGCKKQNLASARAAEAAGFRREGVFQGRLRNADGNYSDEIRYSLTMNSAARTVGE